MSEQRNDHDGGQGIVPSHGRRRFFDPSGVRDLVDQVRRLTVQGRTDDD